MGNQVMLFALGTMPVQAAGNLAIPVGWKGKL
jgi:hypothetical protein